MADGDLKITINSNINAPIPAYLGWTQTTAGNGSWLEVGLGSVSQTPVDPITPYGGTTFLATQRLSDLDCGPAAIWVNYFVPTGNAAGDVYAIGLGLMFPFNFATMGRRPYYFTRQVLLAGGNAEAKRPRTPDLPPPVRAAAKAAAQQAAKGIKAAAVAGGGDSFNPFLNDNGLYGIGWQECSDPSVTFTYPTPGISIVAQPVSQSMELAVTLSLGTAA